MINTIYRSLCLIGFQTTASIIFHWAVWTLDHLNAAYSAKVLCSFSSSTDKTGIHRWISILVKRVFGLSLKQNLLRLSKYLIMKACCWWEFCWLIKHIVWSWWNITSILSLQVQKTQLVLDVIKCLAKAGFHAF